MRLCRLPHSVGARDAAAPGARAAEQRAADAEARDLFTADANSYFSDTAVHDYQASLAPLGKPESFTIHAARKRGGMQMRGYTVEFPKTKLSITTYVQPDGKLEQYIVASSD